jgi:hypothetical protein
MISATTYPVESAAHDSCDVDCSCECTQQEHEKNHFFRGILIAVPAGLALWAGILKVATVVLSHY